MRYLLFELVLKNLLQSDCGYLVIYVACKLLSFFPLYRSAYSRILFNMIDTGRSFLYFEKSKRLIYLKALEIFLVD